nr:imidazole glycerol phosphate synthase subunit HisH [Pigmentibacter ruber]
MKKICIIDYGLGNLHSVQRAFEHCGATVKISSSPLEIINSDRIVIPGVGAYGEGMNNLRNFNLIEPIKEFVKSSKPVLGICLGMQLMLDFGEENGHHEGLSLIPGKVSLLSNFKKSEDLLKLPHIGWSKIIKASSSIELLFPNEDWMYFLHSYICLPNDKKHLLAVAYYNEIEIPSIISNDNIFGCQFHPEKSGEAGLSFIRSFLKI